MKRFIFCIVLSSYHIYGAAEDVGKPRQFSGLRLMREQPVFMPIVHGFAPLDDESSNFSAETVVVEQEVTHPLRNELQRSFCHVCIQGLTEAKRDWLFSALTISLTNWHMRAEELWARENARTLAQQDGLEFPKFYVRPEVDDFKKMFQAGLVDADRFKEPPISDVQIGIVQVVPSEKDGKLCHQVSYTAVEGIKQLLGQEPFFTHADDKSEAARDRLIMFNEAGRTFVQDLLVRQPKIQRMLNAGLHDALIKKLQTRAQESNVKLCGILIAAHKRNWWPLVDAHGTIVALAKA